MDDPFAFMIENSLISSTQEEILRHCPFVGKPVVSSSGDGVPKTAQDASKDRGSRDVFITPPDNQSYAFDFRPCVCHKAVQTDDESVTHGFDDFTRYADGAMFVDLGDDLDLRFSLDELNLMTDRTMVSGCSRGNDGPRVIETSNGEIDKFQVSGTELSPKDSICEPLHKRMKTSEQNPGSKSSQACCGIEPQKIGDKGKLVSNQKSPCYFAADPRPQQTVQIGKEMPLGVEKNLSSGENLGSHVTQSEIATSTEECVVNTESRERNREAEKLACTGKGNKEVNEIDETSEKKVGDGLQKLRIIAERLKDITKGKNEDEKAVSFVFDVFKALTEEASEKEDSPESVSFLELARSRGFTFPTPWWWMGTNT